MEHAHAMVATERPIDADRRPTPAASRLQPPVALAMAWISWFLLAGIPLLVLTAAIYVSLRAMPGEVRQQRAVE
jgi:hypothetical protein